MNKLIVGDGRVAVSPGWFDGLFSLILEPGKGEGVVGGIVREGVHEIYPEVGDIVIGFKSAESVDVLIAKLQEVREMLTGDFDNDEFRESVSAWAGEAV